MQEQLETLVRDHFGLRVHEVVRELAAGHINVSSLVRTEDGDVVVQRLNDVAFSDPDALMANTELILNRLCLLYTSPSPRDRQKSRMPSSA